MKIKGKNEFYDALQSLTVGSIFTWPSARLREEGDDAELEYDLAWPQGTLAVLRQAFALKLSRHSSWDLSAVSDSQAFEKAASVFLRGVNVTGGSGKYPVVTYPEPVMNPPFSELRANENFVVCDRNVIKAWPILKDYADLAIDAFEAQKNLKAVARVLKTAPRNRHWLIIGGGISLDLAAFAASEAKVSFSLVPTTLLSMIDACIGGKTGVNFLPHGKNLVGSFAFPTNVFILTQWLQTLPEREFRSGCGECFKHALLTGDIDLLESLADVLFKKDKRELEPQIIRLFNVKKAIVIRDPFEVGERATLNLGHTLAHALEAVSIISRKERETIAHGEAVSIGILYSLLASVSLGLMDRQAFNIIDSLFQKSGCLISKAQLQEFLQVPLESDELFSRLLHHMSFDKKRLGKGEHVGFVLLDEPGKVHRHENGILTPLSPTFLRSVWNDLLNLLS